VLSSKSRVNRVELGVYPRVFKTGSRYYQRHRILLIDSVERGFGADFELGGRRDV
jgi:hypothetical protein